MKTKQQKKEAIEKGIEDVRANASLIVADITGIPVNELTILRKTLRATGATFTLIKKRLLAIIVEKEGMKFDREQFAGQTAVVFSNKEFSEVASLVHRFAKEINKKKEIFKILGGFLVKEKQFVSGNEVKVIGALPSREVLLGQLVYMLSSPIKQFLFVLNEKAKKSN